MHLQKFKQYKQENTETLFYYPSGLLNNIPVCVLCVCEVGCGEEEGGTSQ